MRERKAGAPATREARQQILAALRGACPGRVDRPLAEEIPPAALGWEDFRQALEEADGALHPPVTRADLPRELARLVGGPPAFAHGAAALLGERPAPSSPRELEGTACLVATGSAAVARTGSVLVTQAEVPVRAHLLFPEALVLLVPEGALVDDLPALYDRLDAAALAGGYFTLVSGPSKTADIEQTLVTGAHGPRRLTVIPLTRL